MMDDDHDRCDLYARFEGGENGRRGQEVESDANWVPSYAREGGNEAEEDEEEEKEAADKVIRATRRIGKGKEKVDEALLVENVVVTYDEYEEIDFSESDSDYKPSGDDAADEDELPDEGTSQYVQQRMRKKKRQSDYVGGRRAVVGELDTSRGLGENALYTNHFNSQVQELHSNEESGTKSSGRKRRKFRKNSKGDGVDMEAEDAQWVKSLRGPQLRLLHALKDLGTERVNTIKKDSLYNCLTPAALRVIGIILEEHVKEQFSLLGGATTDDGVKMQNVDFSSPDELESAENGRKGDEMDDMETDHEVGTSRTKGL